MAIKYVCDFCGQEAKTFHKEFSTGEIICDNCYEHLKNQTWRLAEEPAELEKEQSMDKMMSVRYRNGFYAVIRLYNQMVKALDDAVPKGFLFRRNPFRMISEAEVCNLEQRAIDDVIREVERNFHDNFDYLFERDPLRDREVLRLNDIPTVNLPWNKDN